MVIVFIIIGYLKDNNLQYSYRHIFLNNIRIAALLWQPSFTDWHSISIHGIEMQDKKYIASSGTMQEKILCLANIKTARRPPGYHRSGQHLLSIDRVLHLAFGVAHAWDTGISPSAIP